MLQLSPVLKGLKSWILRSALMRRLLIGSGWLLGSSLLTTLLMAAKALFLARMLGAEVYGTLGVIIAFISLVNQLVDFRSGETVIKFVSQFLEQGEKAKATAIVKTTLLVDTITSMLAFIIIITTASLSAEYLTKSSANAGLVWLYALTILAGIPIGTSIALFRLCDRYDWMAKQDVVFTLIQFLGAIGVVLAGGGLQELLLLLVLVAVLKSILSLWLVKRAMRQLAIAPWRDSPLSLLRAERAKLVRFLISTNVAGTLKGLQTNLDTVLIGYWLGPTPTGYYRLARNIAQMLSFPVTPLYQVAYPEFARLWHQGRVAILRRLTTRFILISGAIGIMCIAVVWPVAPLLVGRVAGESYSKSIPVLYLLMIGIVVILGSQYGHALLMAMGRAEKATGAYAFGVLAQGLLLIVLVPLVGIEGAGIAFIAFASVRAFYLFRASWPALARTVSIPVRDMLDI